LINCKQNINGHVCLPVHRTVYLDSKVIPQYLLSLRPVLLSNQDIDILGRACRPVADHGQAADDDVGDFFLRQQTVQLSRRIQ